MFKMDNQKGPTVQHVELGSKSCASLDGGGLGENGYMCVCAWVPLLFTWSNHDIINQLYPNTK